jgi:hypothetical protein
VKAVLSMEVVIAHFLHKKSKQEDISVTEFREEIVKELLNHENVEENTSERRRWKENWGKVRFAK